MGQLVDAGKSAAGRMKLACSSDLGIGEIFQQSTTTKEACLGVLMEDASVYGSGQQVVGCSDGVDVSGQVQIHLLHWNHLQVIRVTPQHHVTNA